MSTAAIVAGTALGGAALSSNAAGTAAGDQEAAANNAAQLQYQESQNALGFQEQEWNQSQQNLQPWLQAGQGALGNLDYLLGIGSPSGQSTGQGGAQAAPAGGGQQGTAMPAVGGNMPNYGAGATPGTTGPQQMNNPGGAQGAQPPTSLNPSSLTPTGTAQPSTAQHGTLANGAVAGAQVTPGGESGTPGMTAPVSGALPATSTGGTAIGTPVAGAAGQVNGVTSVPAGNPGPGATAPTGGAPSTAGTYTGAGGYGSLLQGYGQTFSAPTAQQAEQSPAEQAQLAIGNQQLQQSAAAQGNLLTGGTAEALQGYGENVAAQNYQNVFNNAYNTYAQNANQYYENQSNQFNRLASISGLGQTTAQQLGTLGQSASNNVTSNLLGTGAQIGQDYNNAGAANASGVVGSANAYSGALGNTSNYLQNLNYLQQLQSGGI